LVPLGFAIHVNLRSLVLCCLAVTAFAFSAQARILTVTTADSDAPAPGETSLAQAIADLQDGDEIQFALPGEGPHLLATPMGGYSLITNNNVTINGWSQAGARPNSNPLLAANNARIQVVLDSRNGNFTSMDYQADDNRGAGYDENEYAILGVFRGTNVVIQGLSLLGKTPELGDGAFYGIAFARDYQGTAEGGQVRGCWIGVAPDGTTVSGTKYAVTAFQHRDTNGANPATVDRLTVGVGKRAASARAEFNVIVQAAVPIVVEGNGTRICGNFLGVLPDGITEWNVALDPAYTGGFQTEGTIQIGRGNNDTIIGVDGDGVNDADEHNVMCGTLPPRMNGYDHSIEFYGGTPGTNIVIAGNLVGVGVDGRTYFTNGVPVINPDGEGAEYRIGSNLDGVSDELEGNFIVNNWPFEVFLPADFAVLEPARLGFLDGPSLGATVSLRGNRLVNNFPFPTSPALGVGGEPGGWPAEYYAQALVAPGGGVRPVLSAETTLTRLVGEVPLADTSRWPATCIDLYVVDPAGLTNGIEAMIEALPFGFVQGGLYLRSFLENGPEDRDRRPGYFDFDLGGAKPPGRLLTVTANYSTSPDGSSRGVVLTSPFSEPMDGIKPVRITSVAVAAGQLVVAWEAGEPPYSVDVKAGAWEADWQALTTTNDRSVSLRISGALGFVRVHCQ
jgi:hypothetical protein